MTGSTTTGTCGPRCRSCSVPGGPVFSRRCGQPPDRNVGPDHSHGRTGQGAALTARALVEPAQGTLPTPDAHHRRRRDGTTVFLTNTCAGPASKAWRSDGADVVCLRSLLALAEFVGHPLPLLQGLEPPAFDGRVMDEDVLAAILWRDEAVALLPVEPLHRSHRHTSP